MDGFLIHHEMGSMMLRLTQKAADQFLKLRQFAQRPNASLRIAVLSGDCAGLKYHIGLDDFRASGDYCILCQDIDVLIDHLSAPYLWDSEIDWMEVGQDAGFVVFNPNAGRSQGGCSNDGSGQGCMTRGDGIHCVQDKSHGCHCHADTTEIIYRIE